MLSESQKKRINECTADGLTPTDISRKIAIPRTTIRNYIERSHSVLGNGHIAVEQPILPSTFKGILSEPKKLNVTMPPRAEIDPNAKTITAVLYGDTHHPYQDDDVLSVVAQVIGMAKPDLIADMGDGLDAYPLSKFDKNPDHLESLQDEIDAYRLHLASFRLLAPKAKYVVLEGNHPDRLRRMLWNLPSEAAAILSLTKVRNAAAWPELLGAEELGITWVPYGQESNYSFLPKFLLKHGNRVRGFSAYTARAEMEQYNRSGASGHTHRLGAYYRRDHNGSHLWLETGCCCRLNPEYMPDPNWNQGCIVLTFDIATGAVTPEIIHIHNGIASFRGNVIRA